MANQKKKKLDTDSLSSSMKESLKHSQDEIGRDLMQEREKALRAFKEQFMGEKVEKRSDSEEEKPTRERGRVRKLSKPEGTKGEATVDFSGIEAGDKLDLFARTDLTSTEKLLLMLLEKLDPHGKGVRMSVRSLAAALGINKNTALDTMISLELKEMVLKESTPRGTVLKLSIR